MFDKVKQGDVWQSKAGLIKQSLIKNESETLYS